MLFQISGKLVVKVKFEVILSRFHKNNNDWELSIGKSLMIYLQLMLPSIRIALIHYLLQQLQLCKPTNSKYV